MKTEIDSMKTQAAGDRLDQIHADLLTLRKGDPDRYNKIRAALLLAVFERRMGSGPRFLDSTGLGRRAQLVSAGFPPSGDTSMSGGSDARESRPAAGPCVRSPPLSGCTTYSTTVTGAMFEARAK